MRAEMSAIVGCAVPSRPTGSTSAVMETFSPSGSWPTIFAAPFMSVFRVR